MGIGDWAQSPIPNPHNIFKRIKKNLFNYFLEFKIIVYL